MSAHGWRCSQVSQHTHIEHNTTGPWHPVPCDLGGCTIERGCVRCLAESHDDWVPPNASCLCAAGRGASPEFIEFNRTYDDRQVEHWRWFSDWVVREVLLTAFGVGLLPVVAFLLIMGVLRLFRSCNAFGGVAADQVVVDIEEASDRTATDKASTKPTGGPGAPHSIPGPHRMASVLKRQASFKKRAASAASTLSEANAAAFSIRIKVSGALVYLGWTCAVLSTTVFLNFGRWFKVAPPSVGYFPVCLMGWPIGFTLMLLGLFPTDAMAIRNTCRFIFVTIGGIGSFLVIFLITNEDFLIPPNCHPTFGSPGACRNSWIAVGVLILLFSSALLALAPTLVTPRCCGSCSKRRAMPPRAALRRVWIVMRVFYFIIGPAAMLLGGMNFIGYFIREGTFCAFCTMMFSFGLTWVLAASFTYPRNRGRIHRWLINLGSRGDQQQEAACIAALINGSDANNVLSEGSKRFRALPLSSIDSDDLSHNKDTSMYVRTNEAKLGEVEAFISHRWLLAASLARMPMPSRCCTCTCTCG